MADYIRFDWAMKRLLRDKANHAVLEGFMTSLLGREVKIVRFLESEGNQEDELDKFNRVDILAEDDRGELIIVEIQNSRELAYFHRMMYGAAKAITDYVKLGQDYGNVRKVYSVNIVYFRLGQGKDCVYHGTTTFRGLHEPHDELRLNRTQCQMFLGIDEADPDRWPGAGVLFPEYYILRVDNFDDAARTPLDEWLSYLKSGAVSDDATAPGLADVRERMRLDAMSKEERAKYNHHLVARGYEKSVIETGWIEGHQEGRIEGREEGRKEGLEEGRRIADETVKSIAASLLRKGMSDDDVADATRLDADAVRALRAQLA